MNRVLRIGAVLAAGLSLLTASWVHQSFRVSAQTPRPAYLVLMVVDGARPGYFNVPNIPHIRALKQNGTQFPNAWAGILESETPSGHASIGTGSEPRRDGIPSFGWVNQDNIPVNLFNPIKIRSGEMERYMRTAAAPSIAGLIHRHNANARIVALSGYKYYAADAIGGPDADAIMYYAHRPDGTFGPTAIPGHVPPPEVLSAPGLVSPSAKMPPGQGDHLAMQLAISAFQRMHQQVTLINLPEFDYPLGHVWGANRDPGGVKTLMQSFDRDLAALEDTYRQAGVLDRTLFVLTADHGFAPIYHTVRKRDVEKAVATSGTAVLRATFHTGGYIWLRDKGKAAAAANAIVRLKSPYIQSVYYRQRGLHGATYRRASWMHRFKVPADNSANRYLLNTFNAPNGPDIAIFFTEHSAGSTIAQRSWKGDHGGASWQSQHIPLIISGPGVKAGYVSKFPARLIDIAPTVLSLMNVSPTGMQGIPLADALTSPQPWAVRWQGTQTTTLTPIVRALEAESQMEINRKP